jgi:pSer/pThr/pTyr-binding forkhead associated (FHA) protein
MLIGRNESCDISLADSLKVSRRHCCIVQCGEKYLLRDLGSMNGIRVNTHRVVEMELRPGDQVAVADINFTFFRDEGRKPAATSEKPVAAEPFANGESQPTPEIMPDALEYSSHTAPEEGSFNGELRLKDDMESGKF